MIKKLGIVIIGLLIFLGVPYIFGVWCLWISWLPALFVMMYLEE